MALCEKEGFIPRYYTEKPQDKADRVLQDLQLYTKTLVMEEMNLGTMIEKAAGQIQEAQKLKESNNGAEDEEQAMEDELFEEKNEIESTAQDLYELLEQEDAMAEADAATLFGEEEKE